MYNFDIIQIQVALLDILNLNQHDRLFYAINEKLNHIFTEPPIILPFNNFGIQNGGFDAPIVQANTPDKKLSMNICTSRIDLFKSIGKDLIDPDINELNKVISGVVGSMPVKPKRIGVVGQYIFKTDFPQKVIKQLIKKNECDYSDITFRFGRDVVKSKMKGKRYVNIQEVEYIENFIKFKAVNVSIDTNIAIADSSKDIFEKLINEIISEYKAIDILGVF